MLEALEWDVRTIVVPRLPTIAAEQLIRAQILSRFSPSFRLLELAYPEGLLGEGKLLPPDPEKYNPAQRMLDAIVQITDGNHPRPSEDDAQKRLFGEKHAIVKALISLDVA